MSKIDLTGQRFGYLIVLGDGQGTDRKRTRRYQKSTRQHEQITKRT